jgi:hypothetical protein
MSTSNEAPPFSQEVITQTVTRIPVKTLVDIALSYFGAEVPPYQHYKLVQGGKEIEVQRNAEIMVFTENREKLS